MEGFSKQSFAALKETVKSKEERIRKLEGQLRRYSALVGERV